LPGGIADFTIDLKDYNASEIRDFMRLIQRAGRVPAPISEQIAGHINQLVITKFLPEVIGSKSLIEVTSKISSLNVIFQFAKSYGLAESMTLCREKVVAIVFVCIQSIQSAAQDFYLSTTQKTALLDKANKLRNLLIKEVDFDINCSSLQELTEAIDTITATLANPTFLAPWQLGTGIVSNQHLCVTSFFGFLYSGIQPSNWPIVFTSQDGFSFDEMSSLFKAHGRAIGFETTAGGTFPRFSIREILLNWAGRTKQAKGTPLIVNLRREENNPETLVVETTGGSDQGEITVKHIGTINLRLIMPLPARIEQ